MHGTKKDPVDKSGSKVVVRRVVRASRERVFDAWTKPELMQHWYVGAKGTSRSTVDLRIGGAYSNEMLLEGQCADSEGGNVNTVPHGIRSYLHHGTYLEIVRPERLVFTWNSPAAKDSRVTVELRAVDNGTEVTITHELLASDQLDSHHEGWSFALAGLAALDG
jgi:uncharacterized protein YndB with AHSA1/START domain